MSLEGIDPQILENLSNLDSEATLEGKRDEPKKLDTIF